MPTAVANDVRNECGIDGVTDSDLHYAAHLASAEIELRELLGDQYDLLAAGSAEEETVYSAADKAKLVKAEALLAGSYALPVINTRTTGQGIVRQVNSGQGETTTLLSDAEVKQKAGRFRLLALKIVRPFIPAHDPDAVDYAPHCAKIGDLHFISVGGAL